MLSHKDTSWSLLKHMKTTGIALAMSAVVASPAVIADNSASAFYDGDGGIAGAMAQAGGAECMNGWCKVLTTTLTNSGNFKDLVIGVSFETMLMTETVVRSKGGNKSTSVADAELQMKVLVDGVMANPGEVVFDKRTQTLWAELGGVLDTCDVGDDLVLQLDECTFTEEEIGLILDTKQASTFNFLSADIGSGSHTIDVYAKVLGGTDADTTDGSSANWSAALGKGTVSVWEVHSAMSK
ncbi:hypothetical protein GCM10009104_21370 [Marinobacterium maritimum]|uniref:Uncharacterized protein n=1 Tax=Marinobacterium maritimum TaxID=500162 RepID=A0ABP3TDC0_9GAMM